MKHGTPCTSDCVEVERLDDLPVVIYPSMMPTDTVRRGNLTPLTASTSQPFPRQPQTVVSGLSIGLGGCRLTEYGGGWIEGLRPGMRVPITIGGHLHGALVLIQVQDAVSQGVYDVHELTTGDL